MEENYSSIFVRNIIQIAKHNNIPIGKLEKKIGVSTGYLSRVCGGVKSIGLDKTLAICKCLNMSIYDILNYDCTHAEIEDIDKQIDELKSKRDSLIDNIKTPDIANIEIDKILPAMIDLICLETSHDPNTTLIGALDYAERIVSGEINDELDSLFVGWRKELRDRGAI